MSYDLRTADADRSDLYDSYETDHEDDTNCPDHGDCAQCIEDEGLDAEVVRAERVLQRLALACRLRADSTCEPDHEEVVIPPWICPRCGRVSGPDSVGCQSGACWYPAAAIQHTDAFDGPSAADNRAARVADDAKADEARAQSLSLPGLDLDTAALWASIDDAARAIGDAP